MSDMEFPTKPGHYSNLEFIRLLTPYVFAQRIAGGKSVLDVGCGFGHGAWLLVSNGPERLVALDIDEGRVRQVAEFCTSFDSFGAVAMDGERLGLKDRSSQLATCFEVIEHVSKPHMLLSEVGRTLAHDGVALFTTPNRALRLLPLQRPWYFEHLREYDVSGFRRILAKHFPFVTLLGIYGEPAAHAYYIKGWRQNPVHVYTRWLPRPVRSLGRALLRRESGTHLPQSTSLTSSNSESDLLNMAVPAAEAETWPFYVSDGGGQCLNFFALCGFDDEVIQRAVREIKKPAAHRRLGRTL